MRASAQARFSGGGTRGVEALQSGFKLVRRLGRRGGHHLACGQHHTQAAAIPMAGAPRTARSWMAAATSSLVVQLQVFHHERELALVQQFQR